MLRRATISDQFEFQKRLWEDRKSYADQLVYVNRRIGAVVERLIADSPRPPWSSSFRTTARTCAKEWPGRSSTTCGSRISRPCTCPARQRATSPLTRHPVNHMRRVFNLYFDAGLPILPDRYFVSSFLVPFKLEEVGLDNEMLPVQPGF